MIKKLKNKINTISRLYRQGVPVSQLWSLTRQQSSRKGQLAYFSIKGEKYYFIKDPATFVYGYSAVSKIIDTVTDLDLGDVNTMIDVGGNNGWFTAVVGRKYPNLKSYIIEPNKFLEISIRKNCDGLKYKYYRLGISNTSGRAKFNVATKNSQQSSLIPEAISIFSDSQPIDTEEILVTTLDKFCEKENIGHIDLLKVDIQGAEYLLLQGALGALSKTKMALFEITFVEENALKVFRELNKIFDGYRVIASVAFGADILFYRK